MSADAEMYGVCAHGIPMDRLCLECEAAIGLPSVSPVGYVSISTSEAPGAGYSKIVEAANRIMTAYLHVDNRRSEA